MIGVILVAASWLLLRFERKTLAEIGFNKPGIRAAELAMGFSIAALAVIIQQLGLAAAAGVSWQTNPDADIALVVRQLRLNINSVLYEELLFRGYLLYLAIRFLGRARGVLLGSAVFGIYHWFSYGVFGSPVAMAFVFIITGVFGLMFAYAFAATKSVAMPIGLHLGWNLVAYLGFSGGPFGAGLFVPSSGGAPPMAPGFAGFALSLLLPAALVAGVIVWLRETSQRPVEPGTA